MMRSLFRSRRAASSLACRLVSVLACATSAACGGGASPPTRPSQSPPITWTLAGSVVDTLTGEPVPGAVLAFSGLETITTSDSGTWHLPGTGFTSHPGLEISADGYLTRQTTVRWEQTGRSDVRLDVIPDRPPFSLGFFRQLVRNELEETAELRPIRRWTVAPNFYVDTTNPITGQGLTPSEIATIEHVIREAVPQMTGGQFAAGVIETGAGPTAPRPGYIAVTFVHEPEGDYCGQAFVAANPGAITMNYDRCRTGCGAFSPRTLAHEVGHALGYWHTEALGIMHRTQGRTCADLQFSDDERLHARVAYQRPVGNIDVDRDPITYLAAQAGTAPLVTCR